jgi:hypothetical protein
MFKIILLFAVSVVYAIVRYVVFAPQNLEQVPVFVVNKGVSTAASLCFALAFWQQWRARRGVGDGSEAAIWFRAGVAAAVAHVPMSLAILNASYFPEFFKGARLSWHGEAVFLCGALTAGSVYLATRPQWTPRQRWWCSLATVGLLFSHVLFMGLARGLKINASHAYLPPMWLLSLIGIALGGWYLVQSRPASESDQTGD